MWSLLLSLAVASPNVLTSSVRDAPLKKRLAEDRADVVLLYAGEQDGSQDPCGCPVNPRGSLARLHAYADAVRDAGDPVVLVNAGNWLGDAIGADNTLRADVRVENRHMLDAIDAGRWSAVNVGFRDLPYLGEVGRYPSSAVSANAQEGPQSFVVVQAGSMRVAITGVTAWKKQYLQPEGVTRADPVEALEALLPEMQAQSDLVVVLGYGLGADAKAIASLDIDVLVEADTFRSRFPPIFKGDTIWVRSNYETQRLGELRLTIEGGVVTEVHDRFIDLDNRMPEPREWRKRAKRASVDVARSRQELFGTL